jgi:hypothetical protein
MSFDVIPRHIKPDVRISSGYYFQITDWFPQVRKIVL